MDSSARRPLLALVLSAGCLRGCAHIGVLKALAEAGIRPDLVVGASAGAVVGALYAAGVSLAHIERAAAELIVSRLKQWTLSRHGLWQGTRIEALLRAHLPVQRIEDFPIRYAAVATELATGEPVVFDAGDAALAVRASTSMPGFFVPTRIGERAYADAGLSSPLPVRIARALCAQRVLAVNVVQNPAQSGHAGMLGALLHPARCMVHALAAHEARDADIVIAPLLPASVPTSAAARQALVDAGEQATRSALPHIRQLLNSAPRHEVRRMTRMRESLHVA